jgi:hypothetical protein
MTEPKRDLTSGFECNGYWWLDESPSNEVAGMFRFDPKEGCSIELLGNLGTHDFESGSVKIIRGVSSTNDRLTLLNCTPKNKQLQQGLFEINDLVCELAQLSSSRGPQFCEVFDALRQFGQLGEIRLCQGGPSQSTVGRSSSPRKD